MNRKYTTFVCAALWAILPGLLLVAAAASGAEKRNAQSDPSYTLNFAGNTFFSDNDLLKAAAAELQMFEQRGFRKADIDDAAFQMRSVYFQAGFALAFVDYDFARKEERVLVTFEVTEGPRIFLEKVIFAGNKQVVTETLRGFFPMGSRRFGQQQKSSYVESEVRDALGKIRDYYRGEGFADVVVKGPEVSFSEDRTGATVTIHISEGVKYVISEVLLRGDLPDELKPELENIKSDFVGKAYYARRQLILRTALEEAYDSIGFAAAKVEIETQLEKETGRTSMQANLKSGVKVRIGKVLISGNNNTRDSFIRNRVQLQPGNIYSNRKRMESFRNLYDSGLFAGIDINLLPPGPDGRSDVGVTVKELPTREYYVEPGWGSYEKARLQAGVLEKNLFGTGRNARLEGLISTKSEKVTLSYTDSWLLQTDIRMNVPLFYDRRDEPSYTSEEIGLSVIFSRKVSRNLTLTTGYLYKMTQLLSLQDDAPLQEDDDDYNKGTLGIQAVWDTRNDIFYPSKGLRLSSEFEISLPALGSDLEFGRITLGCRYFIQMSHEYIIGLRATTGLIVPIKDQGFIPISERFFNGGDTTVRSYEHSELGLKDDNNEPIGGLGYNVFSVELRKRFYKNFAATFYVDAGNLSPNKTLLERDFVPYSDSSDLLDDTLADFFSSFSYGVGIGLQYLLPVGPVRLDIAWNPDPDKRWDEASWVYHFSLGMAF